MAKRGAPAPVRRDERDETAGRWRPDVFVDFVFEGGKFFVAIENIGDRPAVDVSVRFDRPFRGAGGERDVSTLALFKKIPFLAPRRRITTFLDTSASYFARREPTSLSAAVSYADTDGAKYEVIIKHDLSIYRDVSYVTTPRNSSQED